MVLILSQPSQWNSLSIRPDMLNPILRTVLFYMILLSHVNEWMRELERVVDAYEAAVDEVEALMNQLERDTGSEENWPERVQQDHQTRRQLEHALETAEHLAQLVQAANAILNDALETTTIGLQLIAPEPVEAQSAIEPLPEGTLILSGKYRIVQLLHARPRLHLYLAQRLPHAGAQFSGQDDASEVLQQPLVAIRELVLTDLSPQLCQQIERAAFEEFVSPMLLGSPRLPGTGDRMHIENDRHYLIMQLRPARGQKPAVAIPLAKLLLRQQWPAWLDMQIALEWGVQLCRIVARLHHLGVVLGDLNPAIVLVDAEGAAQWAPVLLVSWPPAPQFWPSEDGASAQELCARLFPLAIQSLHNAHSNDPFAAPETLAGTCDQRSDVYSLGAILYLLLTHYAPTAAALRQDAEQEHATNNRQGKRTFTQHGATTLRNSAAEGIALIPPHLFNNRIPPPVEYILLRALALDPAERYASAFDLVEALEALAPQDQLTPATAERKAPRMTRVIDWLKHEPKA